MGRIVVHAHDKQRKAFFSLATFYVVVVILSNVAGGKLVASPFTDGLLSSSLFLFPLTYFIGDLVAELFGGQRARFLVLLGFSMGVLMHFLALLLVAIPPHPIDAERGFQTSLKIIFSFNGLSLAASLIAYLVSQLLDIKIFLWIKAKTGDPHLWLRSNLSTILSQVVDSFILNFVLFYGFLGWHLFDVLDIFISAVLLKTFFSLLLTPLFYLAVRSSRKYALAY